MIYDILDAVVDDLNEFLTTDVEMRTQRYNVRIEELDDRDNGVNLSIIDYDFERSQSRETNGILVEYYEKRSRARGSQDNARDIKKRGIKFYNWMNKQYSASFAYNMRTRCHDIHVENMKSITPINFETIDKQLTIGRFIIEITCRNEYYRINQA